MSVDIKKIVNDSLFKNLGSSLNLFNHLFIFEKDILTFNAVAISATKAKDKDKDELMNSLELFVMKANWLLNYGKENNETTLSAFHKNRDRLVEVIEIYKNLPVGCMSFMIGSVRLVDKPVFKSFRVMIVNTRDFKNPDITQLILLEEFDFHD